MKNHNYFLSENRRLPVIVIYTIFLVFSLWISPARADNVITNGTTVRINSGIIVTTTKNVVVESGGRLAIEGSLILKNNFTNQNAVGDLGTGTIEFSGTTPQSISGQNTIGTLVVNNPAGLDLNGKTTINTELALQSCHIRLSTNNLTLGSTATITGTPSASSMVIATGTGELRKSFSGTGVFTFPVGDDLETAEFSPVTLSFTSGTFASENYAGVKLTNSTYPGYSGNRLNRYWSLTQNGISGFLYDAVFQYVPADNKGDENYIRGMQIEPTPVVLYNPANTTLHQLTFSKLATFGVFTGITTLIQNILLNPGWNIMSSIVIPQDQNLKNILQPLIDEGILKKVMDESGKIIEDWGYFGGWQNTIVDLKNTEGYKINVTAPTTIEVTGIPAQFPFDIPLNAGWNIISWPSQNEQNGIDIFQTLIDEGKLKKVMDESGMVIEDWGYFGGWQNSIGNLMPGEGYKVNVTSACTLTINEIGTKSEEIIPELIASSHFIPAYKGNGTDHANINLVNLAESGIMEGDEIGIFDGNICVGSAKFNIQHSEFDIQNSIGIPVSAADGINVKNGYSEGNPITLKLFRNGKEYPLSITPFNQSKTVFEKGESLFAQVDLVTGLDALPVSKSTEINCYPNPFSDEVTIEINLSTDAQVQVEALNQLGQRVKMITTKQQFTSGLIRLTWNSRNAGNGKAAPGIYHIRIEIDDSVIHRKIVLSK